jgi:thiamine-monophosphate kinase
MDIRELGEFGLIERLGAMVQVRKGVRIGIGDDAALLDALSLPIVTCDALVENVHFRRDWTTARNLGYKALAVNISDIAAMGGRPVAAFVILSLGTEDDRAFVEQLYHGLEDAARQFGLTIAGGDTVRSMSGLHLGITIIGEAARPILRSGARPGDILLVTGTLGDSAAGLSLLQQTNKLTIHVSAMPEMTRKFVLSRHHLPTPRIREMEATLNALNGHIGMHAVYPGEPDADNRYGLAAAVDLSDGLLGDAAHIAQRSEVTLEIEVERLPISEESRVVAKALGKDALDWALRGGEDYELLLCVVPEEVERVRSSIEQETGTKVTAIGRCVKREINDIMLIGTNGSRQAAFGAYTHF